MGNMGVFTSSVLRCVYVQAAWALVRSAQGSPLQAKYHKLRARRGKKKAIVAIARKMLELTWTLVQKQEVYNLTTEEALSKKLRFYKIEYSDRGRVA